MKLVLTSFTSLLAKILHRSLWARCASFYKKAVVRSIVGFEQSCDCAVKFLMFLNGTLYMHFLGLTQCSYHPAESIGHFCSCAEVLKDFKAGGNGIFSRQWRIGTGWTVGFVFSVLNLAANILFYPISLGRLKNIFCKHTELQFTQNRHCCWKLKKKLRSNKN